MNDDELDELEEVEEVDEPASRAGAGRTRAEGAGRSRGRSGRAGAAARTGSGRGPGRRSPRAARGGGSSGGLSPKVLVIGGGVVAVAAVVLIFAMRGKDDGGSDAGNGASASTAANGSSPSGSGSSRTPATTTAKNPRDEYEARLAALTPADAAGRAALAQFCAENRMSAETTSLYRETLLIDPNHSGARAELGFERYDGPVERLRGRWLSRTDMVLAKESETFYGDTISGPRTSRQMFEQLASDEIRRLDNDFPPSRFEYVFGGDRMRQPFLVLIEKTSSADLEGYQREYNELLTTLHDAFFDRYREQFQLEEIEKPAVVVIFESKSNYASFRNDNESLGLADPEFIGGFYQPWTQRLFLWRQNGLRGVLLHEGAHMLIHYAFAGRGFAPSNQSPWFQEGFAEYFGGNKVEIVDGKKTYRIGQLLPGRIRELQFLTIAQQRFPIFELIKTSSGQFNDARTTMGDSAKSAEDRSAASMLVTNIYAEGWAFIMYLHYAEDGKYREVFDKYFVAETKGEGHYETMEELLGIERAADWEELDKRFLTWCQTRLEKVGAE